MAQSLATHGHQGVATQRCEPWLSGTVPQSQILLGTLELLSQALVLGVNQVRVVEMKLS